MTPSSSLLGESVESNSQLYTEAESDKRDRPEDPKILAASSSWLELGLTGRTAEIRRRRINKYFPPKYPSALLEMELSPELRWREEKDDGQDIYSAGRKGKTIDHDFAARRSRNEYTRVVNERRCAYAPIG